MYEFTGRRRRRHHSIVPSAPFFHSHAKTKRPTTTTHSLQAAEMKLFEKVGPQAIYLGIFVRVSAIKSFLLYEKELGLFSHLPFNR